MECVPSNISYVEVLADLDSIPEVHRVHDLRLWSISSEQSSATCHLVIRNKIEAAASNPFPNHEAVLRAANKVLKLKYNISIVTIQVEEFKEGMSNCSDCKPLLPEMPG